MSDVEDFVLPERGTTTPSSPNPSEYSMDSSEASLLRSVSESEEADLADLQRGTSRAINFSSPDEDDADDEPEKVPSRWSFDMVRFTSRIMSRPRLDGTRANAFQTSSDLERGIVSNEPPTPTIGQQAPRLPDASSSDFTFAPSTPPSQERSRRSLDEDIEERPKGYLALWIILLYLVVQTSYSWVPIGRRSGKSINNVLYHVGGSDNMASLLRPIVGGILYTVVGWLAKGWAVKSWAKSPREEFFLFGMLSFLIADLLLTAMMGWLKWDLVHTVTNMDLTC